MESKTLYNVIIIGAGPAGIFSALELVKLQPDYKILIIEKSTNRIIQNIDADELSKLVLYLNNSCGSIVNKKF